MNHLLQTLPLPQVVETEGHPYKTFGGDAIMRRALSPAVELSTTSQYPHCSYVKWTWYMPSHQHRARHFLHSSFSTSTKTTYSVTRTKDKRIIFQGGISYKSAWFYTHIRRQTKKKYNVKITLALDWEWHSICAGLASKYAYTVHKNVVLLDWTVFR